MSTLLNQNSDLKFGEKNSTLGKGPISTKTTALHIAALKSNLELFKFIANINDERNPKNNEGYTPLHIAAAHGLQELFKFIVKDGEENPSNNYGRTPLHIANGCSI